MALATMHDQVTRIANNYYRINSKLPDFDKLDAMWLAVSDDIKDAKVRTQLRRVNCNGYLRGHNNEITVILSIPDSVSNYLRSEE
jgi:hypothetical protein